MSTLTTFIQHNIGSPSHSNQTENEIKGIQTRKKEVKLSMFANNMILCIENPKDSTKKLVEFITEFSTILEYKIIIQKSQQTKRKRN